MLGMTIRCRSRGAVSVVAAASIALLVCADAGVARTLNVTENANLTLVRKSGSVLYEKGTATGTLPGRVTARFEVRLTTVTGTVTIFPTSGGSLTININGQATSAGTVAGFRGVMAVRSGTGRYARARGSGTFSGTVNRRTWAATVRATARLTY